MAEAKQRANSAHVFIVRDGNPIWEFPGLGTVTVEIDRASAQARHFLLNYGVKQWIQDGGAVEAGPDGKVDPAAKFAGMLERAELLNSGATELKRKPSGGGGGAASLVSQALVRIGKATDLVEANRKVKALADKSYGGQLGKARDALAATPKMREAILALQAEKAPVVDSDELLDEIE